MTVDLLQGVALVVIAVSHMMVVWRQAHLRREIERVERMVENQP